MALLVYKISCWIKKAIVSRFCFKLLSFFDKILSTFEGPLYLMTSFYYAITESKKIGLIKSVKCDNTVELE